MGSGSGLILLHGGVNAFLLDNFITIPLIFLNIYISKFIFLSKIWNSLIFFYFILLLIHINQKLSFELVFEVV